MTGRIFDLVMFHALAAAAVAVLAALVGWRVRNPAVRHVLWLLVLAKLLVPSPWLLGVVPSPGAGHPGPVGSTPLLPAIAPAETAPIAPPTPAPVPADPRALVLAVFGLGALAVLAAAVVRAIRFRRLLAAAPCASPELRSRADRVAHALGLERAPAIRRTPEAVSPAVWPGPPCRILLPERLWERLAPEERDALLAHELAHVRRRDHWVRPLELVATALFWWHPVTWWARRNLRAAEEASCDALVLRAFPARSRAYADALLETIEFLAGNRHRPVPALATGADDFSRIKERLTMIVRRDPHRSLSKGTRSFLVVLTLAVLAFGPSWSTVDAKQAAPDAPEPPADASASVSVPVPPAPPDAPESTWLPEMVELQREAYRLQQSLVEIESQRQLLELEIEELDMERRAVEARAEAERLDAEGRGQEAALLRRQVDLQAQHIEIRRAQIAAEQEQRRQELEMASRMQELDLQHRQLEEEARGAAD